MKHQEVISRDFLFALKLWQHKPNCDMMKSRAHHQKNEIKEIKPSLSSGDQLIISAGCCNSTCFFLPNVRSSLHVVQYWTCYTFFAVAFFLTNDFGWDIGKGVLFFVWQYEFLVYPRSFRCWKRARVHTFLASVHCASLRVGWWWAFLLPYT